MSTEIVRAIADLSDVEKHIERHGERPLARLICADSTSHAIRMRGFPDVIYVKDEQGDKDVKIEASKVCALSTVRAWLKTQGLEDLVIVQYRVDNLASGYGNYLRSAAYKKKNKNSKYHLIQLPKDISWFEDICKFAIAECICWNKRDQEAFIDDRAATIVDIGYFIRRARGFTHEAPNHIIKHNSDAEDLASVGDKLQDRIANLVEDLASRNLPGYALDPLPAGVPIPLQLPSGEKRKGKKSE